MFDKQIWNRVLKDQFIRWADISCLKGPNFTWWQTFAQFAAEWQHLRVSALYSRALMEPGAAWQEGNGIAFGLLFTIDCTKFLRGTRGGIWCWGVIVLKPSHMLSLMHLLSPLLIWAVCLQISDILLRLGSYVPVLPIQREGGIPDAFPWGALGIFSCLILL